MPHIRARALVIAVIAIQLGGCSSFLGIKSVRGPSDNEVVQTSSTPATDDGRSLLAAGSTGSAIEAFQRALAIGEPVAPALNGLGVAYARIGRPDLAERFFGQAIATDPAEPRYAANLARLLRRSADAEHRLASNGDTATVAAKPVAVAAAPANEPAPAPGRLQRLSRGEVRIATAAPQAAPARASAAQTGKPFKPLVRISFAEVEYPQGQSFVRIPLPASQAITAPDVVTRAAAQP